MDQEALARRLEAAIAGLADEQREAVVLRHRSGLLVRGDERRSACRSARSSRGCRGRSRRCARPCGGGTGEHARFRRTALVASSRPRSTLNPTRRPSRASVRGWRRAGSRRPRGSHWFGEAGIARRRRRPARGERDVRGHVAARPSPTRRARTRRSRVCGPTRERRSGWAPRTTSPAAPSPTRRGADDEPRCDRARGRLGPRMGLALGFLGGVFFSHRILMHGGEGRHASSATSCCATVAPADVLAAARRAPVRPPRPAPPGAHARSDARRRPTRSAPSSSARPIAWTVSATACAYASRVI
jgi:hypothetical protein